MSTEAVSVDVLAAQVRDAIVDEADCRACALREVLARLDGSSE